MQSIKYIDRITGNIELEKVYGSKILKFFYGNSKIGNFLCVFFAKNPFFSRLYGWLMKRSFSRSRIIPFIKAYQIDTSEFRETPSSFKNFNDFFIRHLKKECRPIHANKAIIPADGRYFFYQNIETVSEFIVKGQKFCLEKLIADKNLSDKYKGGSMVIARLCPVDYHRYHFPIDCTPSTTKQINGYLYSVNPIAIKQNINIFSENKRMLTKLKSKEFGNILFIEIGAMNVGSIIQTSTPEEEYNKGDEKGYFSFGGSALILLFEKNRIQFDEDLIGNELEIRCLMGQSMGSIVKIQNPGQ